LSFAAVPMYRAFCQATGFGGTTQRVAAAPDGAGVNRTVTVTLNADIAPELPWEFAPEVRHIAVRVGEPVTVKYRAKNTSTYTLVGTAVHNVQPDKMGIYFNKTQCFCFTQQVLTPGQEAEFPVTFFLDPDMVKDHKLDDVQDMTLSYSFFLAKDQSKAKLAQNNAPAPTKPY
jgi:cytochrome c oxidase assembly protein subunit 11